MLCVVNFMSFFNMVIRNRIYLECLLDKDFVNCVISLVGF